MNVKSPTGTIHIVDIDYGDGTYSTLCNHVYYRDSLPMFYHMWALTSEEVTCKRCIATKIKKEEEARFDLKEMKDDPDFHSYLTSCGLTPESSLNEAVYKLKWGTHGKPFGALRWVRLIDCSTAHLYNILKQPHIYNCTMLAIKHILRSRKAKQ